MVDHSGLGGPSAVDSGMALARVVAVLDATISLQSETELIMQACLAEGPKGAPLARRGGGVKSVLIYLGGRLDGLPSSVLVDEARALVRYHHRLLAETLDYAYSVRAILDTRSVSYFSDRLGEPAVRMRRLRNLIAGYLGDDPAAILADFGHSLRTPLTTILGNASSILQPHVDWDAQSENRLLQSIVAESSKLARTVDNILSLASMGAGTLRPDFDWCDPSMLVQAAIERIDPALGPKDRVAVVSTVPEVWAPSGLVWADHVLLTRAVANLVDNALRHNPHDTQVTLAAGTHADHLTIAITDNGRGLPAGVAAAVAGGSPARSTEYGTGIPTTVGFVAAHGGTTSLSVSSRSGTSWVIRLPLGAGGSSST